MEGFDRILVVSRSTKYCRKAVHYGVALAKKFGSKLYVLHAMHDPFSIDGWNLPIPALKKEFERMKEKSKEDIRHMLLAEQAEGLSYTEYVREGDPVEEIVKLVQNEQIDVVIMLSHEEWRIEHFFFGRTNEEIMRRMPCSVLFVKKEP